VVSAAEALAARSGWGCPRQVRLPGLVALSGMALAAVGFPFVLVAPAYTPTEQIPVSDWQPPENAVPIDFREPWNEDHCLRLWVVPAEWDRSNSPIRLRLMWETRCPVGGYWSVFVHFADLSLETCQVGDNRHVLAQYDSMPDGGNLPLPAFRPGHVVQETIEMTPPAGIDYAKAWHLRVGLYDAGDFHPRVRQGGTRE
jgi:hypothetical protein